MLKAKKSLSQNFLLDQNIIKKIVNYLKISNSTIIEIGPGTGQITSELIKKKITKLIIIEKDNNLYLFLKKKFNIKKIEIINQDVLKYNFNIHNNIKIISNLPYNISTKIIIKLITSYNNIQQMIFMVQKEFAEKIDYRNKNKNNKFRFFFEVLTNYEIKFNISNNVFFPKPKVTSTVISITLKEINIDKIKLWNFSNEIFKYKRKKIKNVINFNQNEVIINNFLSKRAEDLSTKELLYLFYKF